MADMPSDVVSTAAVNWFDSSNGLHIRVYSTDGYTVSERCADAGSPDWTTGSFSQPGSAVSATAWTASDGVHIRIYCTSNGATTEWCADPGSSWTKGNYTTI